LREFVWESIGAPETVTAGQDANAIARRRRRFGGLLAGLVAAGLGTHGLSTLVPATATWMVPVIIAATLVATVGAVLSFAAVWQGRGEDLSPALLGLGCGLLATALLQGTQFLAGGLAGFAPAARGAETAALAAAVLLPARPGIGRAQRRLGLAVALVLAVGLAALAAAGVPTVAPATGALLLTALYGLLLLPLGRRVLGAGGGLLPDRLLLAGLTGLVFAEACLLAGGEALAALSLVYRSLAGLLFYRAAVAASLHLPMSRLQANVSRFRRLMDAAPDSILMVDDRGRIAAANARAAGMFGCRRERLIGQPVEVLIPQELRGGHAAHRQAYAAAPRTREMGSGVELVAERMDGRAFPAEVSLSPLDTGDGRWVMCVVRDITRRKEAERDLRYQ